MDPGAWVMAPQASWVPEGGGPARFARYEGMPTGTMTVDGSIAVSRSATFSNGTIDFDIKPLAYDDTGIIFRRRGEAGGEMVYLRANPDCPAADDCIQYAPIIHGGMEWDLYPDHQGPAPINPAGWNHVRIVVAGREMLVFVNHAADPSLVVPRLQGATSAGGIAFKGPAVYADLVVVSGSPSALPPLTDRAPDPGTIMTWSTAAPTALVAGRPVAASDIPQAGGWRPIEAEPTGLVNLSRAFEVHRLSTGWLRTTVMSATAVHRRLQLGWIRQVSVFLNGVEVFSGENPYRPVAKRLSPDGRLAKDDASIPLDLKPGKNDLVLAVGDTWLTSTNTEKPTPYGWGAQASLPPKN